MWPLCAVLAGSLGLVALNIFVFDVQGHISGTDLDCALSPVADRYCLISSLAAFWTAFLSLFILKRPKQD